MISGTDAAVVEVGMIAGARGKAGTIAWMTEGGGGCILCWVCRWLLGLPYKLFQSCRE